MRTLIAGLLDRVLPDTRPHEDFFLAAPIRTAAQPKSSARPSTNHSPNHRQPPVGLGRQRHA